LPLLDRLFVIETKGLTKRFDSTVAVNNLDLHVGSGEVYGFLGPNGAGKTTTIHMLLGLVQPTAGEVVLFDRSAKPDDLGLKRRVGVIAEEPVSSPQMTAWEFIRFFADLNGTRQPEGRMAELFEALDLWDVRHGRVREYSHGMRQKLSLIRALVHDPELLILDEPVSGLDPRGIVQVRTLVEAHRRRGGAALISSHILSEIERSADRVGIIHQGRLLVEDTIDGIRRRLQEETVIRLELAELPDGLVPALEALASVKHVASDGPRLVLYTAGVDDVRPSIFETIVARGGIVVAMSTDEISLEEAFVTITNQTVQQLSGAA
jgi:ABC-type multidrug transport system ATPase subunit